MAISTLVRDRFAEGFEAGWSWLDSELPGWRTRKVIPAFDAVLALADQAILTDADMARRTAERVLAYIDIEQATVVGRPRRQGRTGSYAELQQHAKGVLASSMVNLGLRSAASKLLDATIRRTTTPEIRASLLTRRSFARIEALQWNGALEDVREAVELARGASYRVWKPTPQRSPQAALAQRSYVNSVLYNRALLPGSSALTMVLEDSREALALRPRMESIQMIASSAIIWASAQLAFTGSLVELVPYEEIDISKPAASSVQWAQAQWTEGLYRCVVADRLTEEAQACFEDAREDRSRRARANDVVQLTVDLQWWLLREGRHQEAYYENEWIRQHLADCTYEKAILARWMAEIETRQVTLETVQGLFLEVRQVRNAEHPLKRA